MSARRPCVQPDHPAPRSGRPPSQALRRAGWRIATLGVLACAETPAAAPPTLFETLSPTATGVAFVNRLPDDTSFNILNYLYYYNGAGVAVGDVNDDGRPDLYFTSNLGPNHLYVNQGGYRFLDVTDGAGVADSVGWKTGATMADVDGDGHLDIYVSAVDYLGEHGRNVLYHNNGDGTFTDRTAEAGLTHVGYSTQAVFFDYDGDGDLDMYLLNHSTHTERAIASAAQRGAGNPRAADRLYRNDGGRFTDVTVQAGVADRAGGFGLGVVASDMDGNGCPDLYVGNDFQEDDYLYLNNCDGTFTESSRRALGHTSRFSMGVDAADIDNDGRPDLVTVDMLPEREDILKTSASAEGYDLFSLRLRAGFRPQFARNTLQLNRGGGRFSDIGYLAGIFATDWSWAPLIADLDNDGYKDLFITNGIYRRPNDLDYINYIGNEAIQASLAAGITQKNLSLLERMPRVPLANYAFRNRGDLTFANVAAAWGLADPGFSNGAAYVDLDNSGALDLVVNNLNAPPSIYRNRARELDATRHFLTVRLVGEGGNTSGIGARVAIVHGTRHQVVEQMPTRGFQSSVDQRPHFGLDSATRVDSLTVTWPDGRVQTLTNLPVDRLVTVSQRDASRSPPPSRRGSRVAAPLLADVTATSGLAFTHRENAFVDFDREPLMPHLLSTEGPALAVADVNGDGLDDVFIGGAKWQPPALFIQQRDGSFQRSPEPALAADSLAEDVDATFVDVNGDGRPDLYVVSGGNEFRGDADALQDRLYLNDGHGGFRRDRDALPRMAESGAVVAAGDYNGDGYPDLFVGRRVVAGQYGVSPRSYLLENDGRGRFRDVTADRAPGLVTPGMVTSAAWIDYDGDRRLDLVVTGEWMPVRVFRQENGRFVDCTEAVGLAGSAGWWNAVIASDLDADGHPDLVLGNLGLNSYITASAGEPARLYVGDFFSNGTTKQILTVYRNGTSYPVATRDQLLKLMPALKSRFDSYARFGARTVENVLPAPELARARVLEARELGSAVAMNDGAGHFALRRMPALAQIAPVRAALVGDLDGDGTADVLVGGNLYGVAPMLGQYDASYGLALHGAGGGRLTPVDMAASGVAITGAIRHLALVRGPGGSRRIVVARNNEAVVVLALRSRGDQP